MKTDAQGRVSSISAQGIGVQRLIYEAALATKPVVQLNGEALGAIEWTSDESTQLYSKARTWWVNEKKAFEVEARFALFMGPDPIRRTLLKLGDFLSRCVLPALEARDDGRWLEIQTWLNEVRQVGIYPSLALPYFLLQRPDLCGAITATLLEDLRSDNGDRCEAAARALRHWANLFGSKKTVEVPSELIQMLVDRVAFRRKPGILDCTSYLIDVTVEQPQLLTEDHRSLLVGSLMPWHDATTLSATNRTEEFTRGERPDLRVVIARMAGALSRLFRTQAVMPESIAFWKDASASDPLPEVRRAYLLWSKRD